MTFKIEKGRYDAFALCYVIFFIQLNLIMRSVLFFSDGLSRVAHSFMNVFFVLSILWLIIRNTNRILASLGIPLLITLLYFITELRLGTNFHYVSNALQGNLFFQCIPAFICAFLISDFSYIEKALRKFVIVIFFGGVLIIAFQIIFGQRALEVNYLNLSYLLTIPFVYFVCKEDRILKWEYALLVLDAILVILFGGRSAIFCIGVALLYRLIFVNRNRSVWVIIIVLVGIVGFMFYNKILNLIVSVTTSFGLGSGIQKYYSLGNVFFDSGRSNINEISKIIISKHPVWGIGLGGDRYYLGTYGFQYGWYPHSIIYEFLMDYGVVIGTILLVAIIVAICINLFKKEDRNEYDSILKICIFTGGFFVLLFSNSYLRSPLFFVMIAFLIRSKAHVQLGRYSIRIRNKRQI